MAEREILEGDGRRPEEQDAEERPQPDHDRHRRNSMKSSKAVKGTATVIYTDRIGTVPVTSGANQNLRGTTGMASQIAVAHGFWSKGDGGGGFSIGTRRR